MVFVCLSVSSPIIQCCPVCVQATLAKLLKSLFTQSTNAFSKLLLPSKHHRQEMRSFFAKLSNSLFFKRTFPFQIKTGSKVVLFRTPATSKGVLRLSQLFLIIFFYFSLLTFVAVFKK